MSQELQKALFRFLETLAGAFAFGTAVALAWSVDPPVVVGLSAAAIICFLGGIALAGWGVFRLASHEAIRFILGVVAVTASLIAGAFFGGWAASSNEGDRTAHLAAKMTRLFAGLSHEREAGFRGLHDANGAVRQSAAAIELSEAFSRSAEALARIEPPARERRVMWRIGECLRLVSDAYRQLASAAGDPEGAQARLNRARRRVGKAEGALTRCAMGLARHGYQVALHTVT